MKARFLAYIIAEVLIVLGALQLDDDGHRVHCVLVFVALALLICTTASGMVMESDAKRRAADEARWKRTGFGGRREGEEGRGAEDRNC